MKTPSSATSPSASSLPPAVGQAAHICKFCRTFVDLDNEGVTYANGACAHESCTDSNAFEKANESDFRD